MRKSLKALKHLSSYLELNVKNFEDLKRLSNYILDILIDLTILQTLVENSDPKIQSSLNTGDTE